MKERKLVRNLKWTVQIKVDSIWIEDGFELTEEDLKDAIMSHSLGFAYDSEVSVKIIKAPKHLPAPTPAW